jgi:hypothetical protein
LNPREHPVKDCEVHGPIDVKRSKELRILFHNPLPFSGDVSVIKWNQVVKNRQDYVNDPYEKEPVVESHLTNDCKTHYDHG